MEDGEAPEPLGDDDLRTLQSHVREVIETGDPPARKALLQALVHEIRVVSRDEINPTSVAKPRDGYRDRKDGQGKRLARFLGSDNADPLFRSDCGMQRSTKTRAGLPELVPRDRVRLDRGVARSDA